MKIDKTLQKQAQEILQALEANGVDISKYKGLAESLSKKLEDEKERARLSRRKDSQLSPEELEARQKIRQARKQAKEQRERAEQETANKIEEYKRAVSIEKSAQTLSGITDLISVIENERTASVRNNALTSLNSLLGELTEIAPDYLREEESELKKAKQRAKSRARYTEKKERFTTALNSLTELSKQGENIPQERARRALQEYNRNYYFTKTKIKRKLKKEQQQ